MGYSTKLVNSKTELATYKEQIIHLFSLAFEKDMNESLWKWAFMENPCGDPIVSLCFAGDILVGHYAVIPYDLTYQGQPVKGSLSMTTMVHPDHHKKGIFVKLAEQVYEAAKELNYDLVFGFPNKNSAPGFERKLGWSIDKDYHVIKITTADVNKYFSEPEKDSLKFDISNKELVDWRLSKPDSNYEQLDGGLIVKEFEGGLDVMYHERNFSGIDESVALLIICKCESEDSNVLFDYVFGCRFFNQKLKNLSITPSLILSDVF